MGPMQNAAVVCIMCSNELVRGSIRAVFVGVGGFTPR